MAKRQTLKLRQGLHDQMSPQAPEEACVDSAAKLAPEPQATPAPVRATDRDFPNRLSGEALHELAHQRSLARSSLPGMTDAKIREQLRYILQRQYEEP